MKNLQTTNKIIMKSNIRRFVLPLSIITMILATSGCASVTRAWNINDSHSMNYQDRYLFTPRNIGRPKQDPLAKEKLDQEEQLDQKQALND